MLHWTGVLTVAAAILSAAGSAASGPAISETSLAPEIASCIDKNAPDVERAVQSLPEATIFLVGSVCAAPIADEMNRQQQQATQRMTDAAQTACDESKKAQTPAPRKTDDDENVDPCETANSLKKASAYTSGWVIYSAAMERQPYATAYAAKVLLDLRLSHMNTTQQRDSH